MLSYCRFDPDRGDTGEVIEMPSCVEWCEIQKGTQSLGNTSFQILATWAKCWL